MTAPAPAQPELAEVIGAKLREWGVSCGDWDHEKDKGADCEWCVVLRRDITADLRAVVADWYATRLTAEDVVEAVAQAIHHSAAGTDIALTRRRSNHNARAALAAAARQIGGEQ